MRGLLPGLEVAPDSISSDFCSRTRLNYEETQKNVLRLNRGLSVQSPIKPLNVIRLWMNACGEIVTGAWGIKTTWTKFHYRHTSTTSIEPHSVPASVLLNHLVQISVKKRVARRPSYTSRITSYSKLHAPSTTQLNKTAQEIRVFTTEVRNDTFIPSSRDVH